MGKISKKIGLALFLSLLMAGCSSSGGGNSGVTYTGATTPATITSANATNVASTVSGNSPAGNAVLAKGSVKSSKANVDFLGLAKKLINQTNTLGNSSPSRTTMAVQPVNTTINGADTGGSGTVVIEGSIDFVTGYGTLTATFNQFSDDGLTTINGVETMVTDASGMVVSFDTMTISDATGTFSIGGSMKVSGTATNEVVTMNLVMIAPTGQQIKYENFAVRTTYNGVWQVVDESVSGRIYDSAEGYLDITTTSPMAYIPAGSTYPSAGGPMTAVGAGNTKVRVTPVDSLSVLIEADTTGDGNYDYAKTELWTNL